MNPNDAMYMVLSVYWPLSMFCVFVLSVSSCVWDIKTEYQQKRYYVSDLSKLKWQQGDSNPQPVSL